MKKVAKIFSCILVLVMLINNSVSIFASSPLSDDPLCKNYSGIWEIKSTFLSEEDTRGPETPLNINIKNLRSDDKRRVKVSNMPSFVSFGDKSKDCVVYDIAKLLIEAIDAEKFEKDIASNNQKLYNELMTKNSSKKGKERAQNAYRQLVSILNLILDDKCLWRDKNLFISAIDEREDVKLWHIIKRKNQGNWCNFVYIKDLKCAPVATKGSKYDEKMLNCRDLCRVLVDPDGRSIDISKLRAYAGIPNIFDLINNKNINGLLFSNRLQSLNTDKKDSITSIEESSIISYAQKATNSNED